MGVIVNTIIKDMPNDIHGNFHIKQSKSIGSNNYKSQWRKADQYFELRDNMAANLEAGSKYCFMVSEFKNLTNGIA